MRWQCSTPRRLPRTRSTQPPSYASPAVRGAPRDRSPASCRAATGRVDAQQNSLTDESSPNFRSWLSTVSAERITPVTSITATRSEPPETARVAGRNGSRPTRGKSPAETLQPGSLRRSRCRTRRTACAGAALHNPQHTGIAEDRSESRHTLGLAVVVVEAAVLDSLPACCGV